MSHTTAIDASLLPRVADDAVFAPMERLGCAPHAVVDCRAGGTTALALSHWPESGTPEALEDDTSALIVDRYLRAGAAGEEVRLVTNDHYDEDGLLAIWLLLERPPEGSPARRLAIAAAEAGDFGTWSDPAAAKVAIASMRMAERGWTPFSEVNRIHVRARDRDPAGELYLAILPKVAGLLDDPERYRMLWRSDWRRIEEDIALLDSGEARIWERPEADLAVIEAPRPLHDMAVHPRTERMRILTATPDGTLVVRHRYETWVRYVSRPLAPRVDLAPLLPRLQELEERPGRWTFDGVEPIRPRLRLADDRDPILPSSLGPRRLAEELAAFLSPVAR